MSRRVQGLLVGIVGLAALRLALTGDLVFYVRERMRIPLVLGGLVLLAFGIATAWPRRDAEHREHSPRAAWLLLVPVALLVTFTPSPLGADAAGNSAVYTPTAASEYGPLPVPHDGAIDLTLRDYVDRSRFDTVHSLVAKPVRVEAFVDQGTEHGASLARYMIFCCAADSLLLRAHVASWPDGVPPNGQWVEAVVRKRAHADDGDLLVDVVTLEPIEQPADPYLTP